MGKEGIDGNGRLELQGMEEGNVEVMGRGRRVKSRKENKSVRRNNEGQD